MDTRSNTDPGSKIGLNAAVSSGAGCDWLFLRAEPLVVVFRGHRSRLFRLRLRSVHRLRLLFGGLLFGSFRCGLFRHLRLFGGLRLFLGGRVSRIVSLVNVAPVLSPVSFLSGRATAIGVLGRALNSLSTGIRLFLLPSWDASKGRAAVSVETAATSASVAAASAESAASASISASASACAAASANRSRGLSAATTVSLNQGDRGECIFEFRLVGMLRREGLTFRLVQSIGTVR